MEKLHCLSRTSRLHSDNWQEKKKKKKKKDQLITKKEKRKKTLTVWPVGYNLHHVLQWSLTSTGLSLITQKNSPHHSLSLSPLHWSKRGHTIRHKRGHSVSNKFFFFIIIQSVNNAVNYTWILLSLPIISISLLCNHITCQFNASNQNQIPSTSTFFSINLPGMIGPTLRSSIIIFWKVIVIIIE